MSINDINLEGTAMCPSRLEKLDQLSRSWICPEFHQAVIMQVARRGQRVFEKALGKLSPEADSPETQQDTIFPIASLSKVLTATAFMTLVEDGMLSLHNPVEDFIPEFKGEGKDTVMLWNLITHTIGGYSMEEVDDLPSRMEDKLSDLPQCPENLHPDIHEFLNLGYDFPLSRKPGSGVIYSNYGFELLGEIIRRVTGQPLAEYFEQRISEPLEMHDTHFILPEEKKNRVIRRSKEAAYSDAKAYFHKGVGSSTLLEIPWASSGAFSTANDLIRLGQMFLNSGHYNGTQILSPATVAYMTMNQTPGLGDCDGDETLLDGSRGIGWDIPGTKRDLKYANLYTPSTFSHSGAGGSLIWVDPAYELVGVFLSVELTIRPDGQRSWTADRFVNAVTASILE